MITYPAPRIGVLALMLGAYEPLFPDMRARQESYVRELLAEHAHIADFDFPGAATDREQTENIVAKFNREGMDGILILLLSYAQGQAIVRAMQDNRLPLALALVQPEETVRADVEEIDWTVNQCIHGAQDNANALMRAGIGYAVYAGSRKGGAFGAFLSDFARAARTARALRRMKIGVIGKLALMGDVLTDEMAFYRVIGPELTYDTTGMLVRAMAEATERDVDAQIARDREIFEIDPKLTLRRHRIAARMTLGVRRYLAERGYAAYTLQFDDLGADGRFVQLPFLAASHMLAEGYGYAAEGDATTAALCAALQSLCGEMSFTEMYAMDLARDAIFCAHAGESNFRMAKPGSKPRLIDRVLTEGGLDNPPTPLFQPRPGRATLVSLTHIAGERFRLTACAGEMLDEQPLLRCDMPYFFFRPDCGAAACATRWLELGAPHHEAYVLSDARGALGQLCTMLKIEYTEV